MNPADLLNRAEKAWLRRDLHAEARYLRQALDQMLADWPDIADWSPSYRGARATQAEIELLLADPLGAVRD